MEYWVSPAVRKVLACKRREGETVDGKLVDNLAPEVVMARFISGTASSIRVSSRLISLMMSFICISVLSRFLDERVPLRMDSSDAAAFANRCPSAWMPHRRDLVRATADSRDVFPRAALEDSETPCNVPSSFDSTHINSIMSMDGEMTYIPVSKHHAVEII